MIKRNRVNGWSLVWLFLCDDKFCLYFICVVRLNEHAETSCQILRDVEQKLVVIAETVVNVVQKLGDTSNVQVGKIEKSKK